MESFVVNAEVRDAQGTGASRRLRRQGKVPGILYGGNKPPQPVVLDHNDLKKHLEIEAFYSHVLTVKLGKTEEQAVLKDVQRHPAKPYVLHVDLLRVLADREIRMRVPLHFAGGSVAPGVKTGGGRLEHLSTDVEVECLPKDLPEFIEVDCSGLGVDESLHLSDLKIPAGVTLVALAHGDDVAVAAVHLPRVIQETEEVAEAAEGDAEVPTTAQKGEAAEGEGEGKDEDEAEKK